MREPGDHTPVAAEDGPSGGRSRHRMRTFRPARCATRAEVDAFYLAAIAHQGADEGRPGLRSEYHPDYYGAFVRDPDGNKIEACCHGHE